MIRRHPWIVGILGLSVILTASAAVLWSAQSAVTRRLAIRQLSALTNRQATIERLALDLRRGRLEVEGLRLADRQSGPPLAELDRLDMRFDPRSLLRGGLAIEELALRGVRVRIVRSERGELNLPDLGGPSRGSFNVTLDRLTLADGHVAIEDHTRTPVQHWRADDIAMEASGLSTSAGQVPGSARLVATVGGAPVAAEISGLHLSPLHLRGKVDAKDIDATVAGIALPADLAAVAEGARLTISAALTVDAREGVSMDARGRLDALTVRDRRTGNPLASLPALAISVEGMRADASGSVPMLGRIAASGAATLFHARGPAAGRLQIENLRLSIEQTAAPSSAFVGVSAAFSGGGGIEVHGPLGLAPFATELRGRVTDLDASVPLSYVNLPVRVSGALDGDLILDLTSSAGGVTSRIRGRAAVKRAAVTDGARELLRVKQIDVDGVDAGWPRVDVARVRVVEPVALVARDRDGRVTSAALFAPARPAPGRGSPASVSPGPTVAIREIAVVDGTLTLDDASAQAPVRLALTKLRATARNVTWPASRRPVSVEVQAGTPDAGTLQASGTVSLDPPRVELRARVTGAALAPYQGYLPFPMKVQGFAHLDLAIAGSFGATTTVTARGTGALNDLTMSDEKRRIMRVSRVETTGLQYAWPATFTVDRLRVGRSRVRVERRPDGAFPLAALLARPPASTVGPPAPRPAPGHSSAPAFSVTIGAALLEDGGVRFVDGVVNPTARIDLAQMRLAARGFTWPARGPVPIELRMTTPGGGRVSMNGSLDLASTTLDAKAVLDAVDLAPAQAYLPAGSRVAGKASTDLDVRMRWDSFSISARGSASLGDVAFTLDDQPLMAATRVEATGLDYAWPATVAVDRLRVRTPRAVVERTRHGRFPLVAFFTGHGATPRPGQASPPTPAAPPPPLQLAIRESVLEDGSATMTDRSVSPAAQLDLTRVRLVVRDLAWPPQGPTSVRMRASLPGEGTVRARGQLGLAPTTLELDVTADGVDLGILRPYLPLRGQALAKAGATLKVTATTNPLAITARGTASVSGMSISERGQPLLTAERIKATALDYAWPATVKIDRLRVEKLWAVIDRVSGQLPVLQALRSPGPREARSRPPDARRRESRGRGERRHERLARTPPGTSGPPPLQLTLRRAIVDNGAAAIVDARVDPPTRFEITGARLVLRDLAWPPRGASGFVLRAATPSGGRLEARGQFRLDAPAIDTRVVLERADLASLQPLVPIQGRLAGQASADLQIKGPLAPMALSVTGTLAVADVSLGDAERPLVTAKGVDLAGVAAEWPGRRATIGRIRVREPWVLVERDADGTLPLLPLVAPRPASGATSGPDGATTPDSRAPAGSTGVAIPPAIDVGTLVVEDGFVRFTDRTTRPRFVEEASHLALTAQGLGTAPATRGTIAASARLSGGAQVDLHGALGPLGGPLFLDVQGKLSALPLNRANPYLNKLLGWIARQGSIGGTTHFRIRDDSLQADNEIVIGRPLFAPSRRGDEVRERVGVPLDLLASLLEDSHREIRMSVPVTGTLSSRHFDFGDAVWDAIRRAAINILALPVSWVGKVLYTDDSRIATISIWPVSFEPGTTQLRRGIDKHAERLANFMRQTPGIAFAMRPVMTLEDVDALKRAAVRRRIDALAHEAGTADAAAARLFAERFPDRAAPAEPTALLAELARVEPVPDGALRALADARVALVRRELQSKGDVNPARLRASEGALAVEASGQGRVEFEMVPGAPPTP